MADRMQGHKEKAESTRLRRPAAPAPQGPVTQAESADLAVLQRAVADPGQAPPADILALQRAAGNRAVNNLITTRTGRPRLQASLMVGPAGDAYEQEADRIADQVLANAPAPAPAQSLQRQEEEEEVQAQPLVQRQEEEAEVQPQSKIGNRQSPIAGVQTLPLTAAITPLQRQGEEEEVQTMPLQRQAEEEEVQTMPLQRQAEEEEVQTMPLQRQAEEEEVQTKSAIENPKSRIDNRRGFEAGPAIEARLAARQGAGAPLSTAVRSALEPRFGADFSGVRVHTDAESASMNRALQAQAFTHGQNIYLGAGRYNPGSSAGKRLLAHELVHVIQQTGGGGARRAPLSPAKDIQRVWTAGAVSEEARRGAHGAGLLGRGVGTGTERTRMHRAGRAIAGAGHEVAEGVASAGRKVAALGGDVRDLAIAGAYTAGQNIASAGRTVAGGARTAGQVAAYGAMNVGAAVKDVAVEKAHAVGGFFEGLHKGLKDEVEPVAWQPADSLPPEGLTAYAADLMHAADAHEHLTQKQALFLEQDEIEIDSRTETAMKDLEEKQAAIQAIRETSGIKAKIKGTADEQRAKLNQEIASLSTYIADLQAEKPKAEARTAAAQQSATTLRDYLDRAGVTYDDLRDTTQASRPITPAHRAQVRQVAHEEKAGVKLRNTVTRDANAVRETGRSERLFTYGMAKLIGSKVANVALQTATLTMMGVETKDRPGGYSTTVHITNIFSKSKAQFLRLEAIGGSSLYGNRGASMFYAILKGVSTLAVVPLRDLAGALGLLSTGVGTLLGAASLGTAAAPFVMASTILGYIALGLTGLNALLNGTLAIWNAIRLKTLRNERFRSQLAKEGMETAATAITETITAGAQSAGIGVKVGGIGLTEGWGEAAKFAKGGMVDKALWIPIAGTGISTGLDIAGKAVPPKAGEKIAPRGLAYKERTETDQFHEAYKPRESHGFRIGGHKVGVPHPAWATETVPWSAYAAGTAVAAKAGEAKEAIGAKATAAKTAVSTGLQLTANEMEKARKKAGEKLSDLAGALHTRTAGIRKSVGKVTGLASSISKKFSEIKAKFSKPKAGPEQEATAGTIHMGSSMSRLVYGLLEQLPGVTEEAEVFADLEAQKEKTAA